MTSRILVFICAAYLPACSYGPAPAGKLDPQRIISTSADLAAHDEFPNEWWYYAGRLEDEHGTAYAFYLSFFKHWARRERRFGFPVRWVDNPGRFAHGKLTNLATGESYVHETVGVARRGTAGARSDRFHVWTGDWFARGTDSGSHLVSAGLRRAQLELELTPRKPLIVHAGDGTGKPPSVGKSQSYYISSTRMAIAGSLDLGGEEEPVAVEGEGWFDHEIIGMEVARGKDGWDWFALQLDDDSEMVIYLYRFENRAPSPGPAMVALIDRHGRRQEIPASQLKLEELEHWKSPRSGARYPVRWQLSIPSRGIDLTLSPTARDSEVRGRFSRITYWEGLVEIEGTRRGKPLGGHGYVELTGYVKSMREL